MKILGILFSAMLSSGLYAQSVIVNPDGTHSVVIDHGVHKVIVKPDGSHSVAVSAGSSNILVNPDGTHSQLIGEGNTKILVNPNRTHSYLLSQDDSQQMLAKPNSGNHRFIATKRGAKTIILPDGSVLHFKKVKQMKRSKTKKPSRF